MRVTLSASTPHLPGHGLAGRASLRTRAREAMRTFAHRVFGDYGLYRMYSLDLAHAPALPSTEWRMASVGDPRDFGRCADPSIRGLAAYSAPEAHAFGAWIDGRLVAGCWFWFGETYRRRNFWPLSAADAKLVQITTAEEFRGRGIAPVLIAFAAEQMRARGFKRLFARIWHSHAASLAAFRKAGWKEEAFVVEVFPLRARKPLRLVRRRAPR